MQEIKRLAIISTHPVQYYAPLFRLLHERAKISIKVYYTWGEASLTKHDPGFNKIVEWDLPLLKGYPYEWCQNNSNDPGSHHFKGIKTPVLQQQIAAYNPDAIFIFGWAYHSHLSLIRHFSGKIPLCFRGDSTLLDETGIFKSLFRKIYLTWVYKHIDHAFYTGSRNKEYFKNYGLEEEQLTFTPHAIDNERFAEDRQQEAKLLREELGAKERDILILFAGKLEAKKDPEILLKAFLELKRSDVHLLFVGNGCLEKKLKDTVNELTTTVLKSGDRVHFMDFQNQKKMPSIYQGCDLFCLPSKGPGESWGLAVNEAMACGKAILVSDKVGAAADLVRSAENGQTFIAGNLTDLKKRLKELTFSRSQLKSLGKKSNTIINDWNFNKIVEAIEDRICSLDERYDVN